MATEREIAAFKTFMEAMSAETGIRIQAKSLPKGGFEFSSKGKVPFPVTVQTDLTARKIERTVGEYFRINHTNPASWNDAFTEWHESRHHVAPAKAEPQRETPMPRPAQPSPAASPARLNGASVERIADHPGGSNGIAFEGASSQVAHRAGRQPEAPPSSATIQTASPLPPVRPSTHPELDAAAAHILAAYRSLTTHEQSGYLWAHLGRGVQPPQHDRNAHVRAEATLRDASGPPGSQLSGTQIRNAIAVVYNTPLGHRSGPSTIHRMTAAMASDELVPVVRASRRPRPSFQPAASLGSVPR